MFQFLFFLGSDQPSDNAVAPGVRGLLTPGYRRRTTRVVAAVQGAPQATAEAMYFSQ
jgi:hypothetical protein